MRSKASSKSKLKENNNDEKWQKGHGMRNHNLNKNKTRSARHFESKSKQEIRTGRTKKIEKEKRAPAELKARSFKCQEMAEASTYQKTHHRKETKETDQLPVTRIINQKTGKKKARRNEIKIEITNQSSIQEVIDEKQGRAELDLKRSETNLLFGDGVMVVEKRKKERETQRSKSQTKHGYGWRSAWPLYIDTF